MNWKKQQNKYECLKRVFAKLGCEVRDTYAGVSVTKDNAQVATYNSLTLELCSVNTAKKVFENISYLKHSPDCPHRLYGDDCKCEPWTETIKNFEHVD